MFIPIGDEPNPRERAVVTWALIAANVIVFLLISLPMMSEPVNTRDPAFAEYVRFLMSSRSDVSVREIISQTSAYDLFTWVHGFKPGDPSVFSLFESLFLHGGWLHIIGNMLFLWIYGDNVEARVGKIPYLLLYLGTGAAATLFFALFADGSMAPLIGASGAISGVLGAYFWWFPQNRVKVLVILFFFIDVWRIPARWVLAAFIVVENLIPAVFGGTTGGGVAYGAHIGGFLAGLATALVLGRGKRPEVREAPGPAGRVWGRRRDEPLSGGRGEAWVLDREGQPITRVEPAGSFRQTIAQQRYLEAAEQYARMSPAERGGETDDDVIALARGLGKLSRPEAALAVLQSFIGARPNSHLLAEAHYLAAMIHLEHTGRLAAAREHLMQVLDLNPPRDLAAGAKRALSVIEETLRGRHESDPSG